MARYVHCLFHNFDTNTRTPEPIVSGTCGLYNLGNTCYLSSLLQCLAHTPALVSYAMAYPTPFVNGKMGDTELYDNNIVSAFFAVVKTLWSCNYAVVTPKALKRLLGAKYEQFNGSTQQDAHEVLLLLLDELNKSLQEPLRVTEGTPPANQAERVWQTYLAANNSIITETFSGQLEQVIVCRECGRQSVAHDPFNCLSLTIPSLRRQKGYVPLVLVQGEGSPICCKVLVTASPTVAEINAMLVEQVRGFGVINHPLYYVVVRKNKRTQFKLVADGTLDLTNYDKILVYELAELRPLTVVIQIREIREKNVVVLHNTPVVITADPSETGTELHRRVKERMRWMGKARVVLVNEECKMCGRCGEKVGCVGCALKRVDDLATLKKSVVFVGYDFTDKVGLESVRANDSWLISNTQRLQTTAVSLFGCLTLFTHGDSFEFIEWKCHHCNKMVMASVAISVWRPPRVLIIQLKRFAFTESFRRIKTKQSIIFPPVGFDLKEYISNDEFNNPVPYDLFAVINHEGTIDKGHYSADCLVNGEWHRFNDEKVGALPEAPNNSDTAYILFYKLRE